MTTNSNSNVLRPTVPGLIAASLGLRANIDLNSLALPEALAALPAKDPRRVYAEHILAQQKASEGSIQAQVRQVRQVLIDGRSDVAARLLILSRTAPAVAHLRAFSDLWSEDPDEADKLAAQFGFSLDAATEDQRTRVFAGLLETTALFPLGGLYDTERELAGMVKERAE